MTCEGGRAAVLPTVLLTVLLAVPLTVPQAAILLEVHNTHHYQGFMAAVRHQQHYINSKNNYVDRKPVVRAIERGTEE